MLSKREKLYQQPWNERRYQDHRYKSCPNTQVKSALPAIDDRAPLPRPHVVTKLKKVQREMDRTTKIQNENFSLLQRLSAIMKVNRLDNHWTTPLPNFQHKVGRFYNVASLNTRLSSKTVDSKQESHKSTSGVKCYACESKKMKTFGDSFPSIQ